MLCHWQPDMRIIAQSATGDEALDFIRTKKPTIAVLDVRICQELMVNKSHIKFLRIVCLPELS